MGPELAQNPRPRIASFRELRAYLREDYQANHRNFWAGGFQALAIYRLGVWHQSIGSRLQRGLVGLVYHPLAWFSRVTHHIHLSPHTRIGRRLRLLEHGIVIHHRAVIGDDCLIRHNVTIGAVRSGRQPPPVLGNRVQVAAGAVIAGSIVVGDDVTIGPNAVVMTNVPPGSVVAAPPPRIMTPPPRRAVTATPAPEASGQPAARPVPDRMPGRMPGRMVEETTP